jgi:CelD/BcsL family acetyltransferase involved in cellulose biosynthesis
MYSAFPIVMNFTNPLPDAALSLREYRAGELSRGHVARWRELADRSLDPNPFLEPEFVVPLLKHLGGASRLVVVEEPATSRWLAAGLFQRDLGCRVFPLPHLASHSSPYTFLDQPLLDGERAGEALDVWFQSCRQRRDVLGLRFRSILASSATSCALASAAARNGVERHVESDWDRAQLVLAGIDRESLLESYSKSRRKSLRRARKELESRGRLKFGVAVPFSGDLAAADRFLRLESRGWKGRAHTSLQSDAAHARFFREMIVGFSKRRSAWFGELNVGRRTIASTCNVRSGNALFAFKVGWEPDFADGSPGLWSELELAHRAPQLDPTLERIDSCSTAGSHLESVWKDRCRMQSVTFAWSRRARLVDRVWRGLRAVCRALRGTGR